MAKEIKRLALFLISIFPTQVYLRVGYEFDSPENNYQPLQYVTAYRRIVNDLRMLGVVNVAYVWHSYSQTPQSGWEQSNWYPGDDYVDWCGVSIFQQPYACQIADKCLMQYADELALFCKNKKKPIMIAESTPFGGIKQGVGLGGNEAGYKGNSWNAWYVPVLSFISRHDVRIWSYINCNWDAQPMWQLKHANGVAWGDSRIEAYPTIMRKWQDEVLHNDRFKWADKAIGKEHYCRDVLGSAEDETSYDDDDVYLDIKNKEHDFSTLYITWTFFVTCITSNTAVYVYIGLAIIAVIYGLYRMTVNQGVLRLSRTKSGYSLVA